MTKLDLDTAKMRCEECIAQGPLVRGNDPWLVINHDLPAALAECEWSREMLEKTRSHIGAYRDMCRDVYKYEDMNEADVFLRALEKGPPDELA